MKKLFLSSVLFFILMQFAFSLDINPSIADNLSDRAFFTNPASFYFYGGKHKLSYEAGLDSTLASGGLSGYGRFMFSSSNIAAGFRTDVVMKDRVQGNGSYTCSFENNMNFSVAAALGIQNYGFGVSIEGGSVLERTNCFISEDSAFGDVLRNGIFARFQKRRDSEYLNVGVGLEYAFRNVTIAVVVPKIISYESRTTVFSGDSIYKTISVGALFHSNTYGIRGHLNLLTFCGSFELENAFYKEDMKIKGNLELSINMARNNTISLSTGIFSPVMDYRNTFQTFGLEFKINQFYVKLNGSIPVEMYKNTGREGSTAGVFLGFSR